MKEIKVCTQCGEEKEMSTKFFYKRKSSKDGFRGQCKECWKNNRKNYYQNNKDIWEAYHQENKQKIKENRKKYRADNKEYLANYQKEYYPKYYKENKIALNNYGKEHYEENKDKYNALSREYYINNKQSLNEYGKKEYRKNKKKYATYFKKYQKENKELIRIINHRYRSKKKNSISTLNKKEWIETMNYFNNSCAYCGMTEDEHIEKFNQRLHQDHFIPLSMGGNYTKNNIIPSCIECNSSKNNKNFFTWYIGSDDYNEERQRKIIIFLGIENNKQKTSIL